MFIQSHERSTETGSTEKTGAVIVLDVNLLSKLSEPPLSGVTLRHTSVC